MKTIQYIVLSILILLCPLVLYAQQPVAKVSATNSPSKSMVYQNKELKVYASKSKTGAISYEGYGADGGRVTLKKVKTGGGGKGGDCATCCGRDSKG